MKKFLKIFIPGILLFILFMIIIHHNDKYSLAISEPYRNIKNYYFNPELSLTDRIKYKNDLVLNYMKKLDNNTNYKFYKPDISELTKIKTALNLLPPLHKKILEQHLIGIFFIKDFISSGYTDWIMDKNKNIYTIMIFNPRVLKNNISELLTFKENTCFINNNSKYKININCGNRYNSFIYILTHESTHVVDYINNVTPYTEPYFKDFYTERKKHPFTEGIWQSYFTPKKQFDFPERKNIDFYGLSGGPKIKITDAVKVYKKLSKTPFVSLYGSKNWAEDLAEFTAFYHITQKLHLPYTITVKKNKKIIFKYEPMTSSKVIKRFKAITLFYNE